MFRKCYIHMNPPAEDSRIRDSVAGGSPGTAEGAKAAQHPAKGWELHSSIPQYATIVNTATYNKTLCIYKRQLLT